MASPGSCASASNLGAGANAPPVKGNFQVGFPYGDPPAIFKLAK